MCTHLKDDLVMITHNARQIDLPLTGLFGGPLVIREIF